ncbi:MAG: type IV pilin [Halarchaeum sp.]
MSRDGRALSTVVGGALLLLTVALVATAGAMVLGFSDQLSNPPPFVSEEESVTVDIVGNEAQHSLELVHRNGEPVDASALSVAVTVGGTTTTIPVSDLDGGALDDGEWSAGERLNVSLNRSTLCDPGGDSVSVQLRYRGARSSYLLSEKTVPVERGQFAIDGSRVRASVPYTANVKFLGTGWGSADSDAPVNVTVAVGGERATAWTMVHDHDTTVGAYGVSRQDAGTDIEVRAAGLQHRRVCGPFGLFCHTEPYWVRVSSTGNSENVRVYRDGNATPDVAGANGQTSAERYVDPYVENGTITLDDNQAIYLFDFNEDERDYQGAVVLVSFFTQREETGVYRSSGRDTILCPAETRSASPNAHGH